LVIRQDINQRVGSGSTDIFLLREIGQTRQFGSVLQHFINAMVASVPINCAIGELNGSNESTEWIATQDLFNGPSQNPTSSIPSLTPSKVDKLVYDPSNTGFQSESDDTRICSS
jgi:hypothetical protein